MVWTQHKWWIQSFVFGSRWNNSTDSEACGRNSGDDFTRVRDGLRLIRMKASGVSELVKRFPHFKAGMTVPAGSNPNSKLKLANIRSSVSIIKCLWLDARLGSNNFLCQLRCTFSIFSSCCATAGWATRDPRTWLAQFLTRVRSFDTFFESKPPSKNQGDWHSPSLGRIVGGHCCNQSIWTNQY